MKPIKGHWVLAVFTLILLPHLLASASFGMTLQRDEDIVIGEDVVIDGDLFLIGKSVTVQGTVHGDLFVAARDISVNGHVMEDAHLAGGHVTVSGVIEEDAHIAAQLLEVKGRVEGDLFFVGPESHVWQSGGVGGDYIFAGSVVMTHGPVSGYLLGGGKEIYIDGEIGGSATLAVKELIFSKRARIAGDLRYVSENEGRLHEEAVVKGDVLFKQADPSSNLKAVFPLMLMTGAVGKVLGYFMLLVTGLVLVIFTPLWLKRLTDSISDEPGRCACWGAIAVFAAPVGIGIAFATIVGSGLAGLAFSLYMAVMYISQVVAGLFLGILILRLKKMVQSKASMFGALALGLLIVQAVRFIPVVGALLWIAAGVFGFGAMIVSEAKRP